jgi:hypothetical protein
MAYRFRDPSPVFENLLGLRNAPGGQWFFYELGTSTPKDTYQEYALTTPNTNPITLTAAGRFPVPVWLDGDYTVELKASDGSSIINPTDIRPEIAPGLAIPDPTGHAGEYLTNDGSTVQWSGVIWNLPDPTGSASYMVVVNSDGTDYILQPIPEPVDPAIAVTTNYVTFGMDTGDKWMIQKGTGTAPATGTFKTSVPVTFSPTFKSGTVPFVAITPLNTQPDGGPMVAYSDGAPTASGFTPTFDVAEGDSASPNVTAPVTFLWEASGVYDG